MSAVHEIEPRARRHRALAVGLVFIVALTAWAFTIHRAQLMDAMEAAMQRDMNMSLNGMEPSWTLADALFVLGMWAAMMAAMMLPGTMPMISAFATINARRRARGAAFVPTSSFVLGYLLVWTGFSVIATGLQYVLQRAELLSTMMQSSSYWLSAVLFLSAGAYQFSALKNRCLALCRSPDGFVLSEWRDGALGAVVMGGRHGLFCAGCCAALMLLLFAVGVMDLRWVALLSAIVTGEKLLPLSRIWKRGIAFAMLVIGVGYGVFAFWT
jgi:predicted metal-binding membrane protein